MSEKKISFSIIFNILLLIFYTLMSLVWNWGKIDIMNVIEYGIFTLCIIITVFSKKYINKSMEEINANLGIIQSSINESIIGITIVFNFILEKLIDDIKITIFYGLIVIFIIVSWNILIIYINNSYNKQNNKYKNVQTKRGDRK